MMFGAKLQRSSNIVLIVTQVWSCKVELEKVARVLYWLMNRNALYLSYATPNLFLSFTLIFESMEYTCFIFSIYLIALEIRQLNDKKCVKNSKSNSLSFVLKRIFFPIVLSTWVHQNIKMQINSIALKNTKFSEPYYWTL